MKFLYGVVLLWGFVQSNTARATISTSSLVNFTDVGGVFRSLNLEGNHISINPADIFYASIRNLISFPEQAVFSIISKTCALYMETNIINPRITPDIKLMALILHTPSKNLSFSLARTADIFQSNLFDIEKKVVIFVTGWLASPKEDYVADMAHAFNCRGGYNFLVLNSSNYLDTFYTWSAYNTEEVGRELALALAKLVQKVPVERIHLIGHSLGAHIAGYAGRYLNIFTGLNIPRITGLDPANPCFNEGQTLSGLQRGDADFIDIIHTNPGILGKENPMGDVDFYPQGLEPIKPGCLNFGCSHARAYKYFIESIYPGNERNFLGVRCTSLTSLNNGFCKGRRYPMGLAVPYNLKGNYFLFVNSKEPYGQNCKNRPVTPKKYVKLAEAKEEKAALLTDIFLG